MPMRMAVEHMIDLLVGAAGLGFLIVALRVALQASDRRHADRRWRRDDRTSPMRTPPPRRYDPATSDLYADQRVLTPTRS